jgi:hypothetical protein
MIRRHVRMYPGAVFFAVVILLCNFGVASAENAASTNYQVTDTQFGSGSVDGCSTSYCANGTAGDLTTGSAKSTSYQAEFGSDTQDMPLLEVIANGGNNNLGTLSSSSTATASTVVKVRAYEISGYTIQISGTAPSDGTHTLDNLSSPTASHAGTEQFGMNLEANTTPSVGTNPVQVPDSTFSFGTAASNYNTANEFTYNNGDIVAQSTSSSGETDYTISMIINISNVTPAGQYSGSYSAVVVPVY